MDFFIFIIYTMEINLITNQLIEGIQQTSLLEFIGVVSGIISVWLSTKENIWVYPIGLINTIIYVYISIKGHLLGEASVNVYYTIMSVYGWVLWAKKDEQKINYILHITYNGKKDWIQQLLFFSTLYVILYLALIELKQSFAHGAIPWLDAFASATAYTAMWLMAKKKVASWYWWIATNCTAIYLYFVKGYVFTSLQFIILVFIAIQGLIIWNKKAQHATH